MASANGYTLIDPLGDEHRATWAAGGFVLFIEDTDQWDKPSRYGLRHCETLDDAVAWSLRHGGRVLDAEFAEVAAPTLPPWPHPYRPGNPRVTPDT